MRTRRRKVLRPTPPCQSPPSAAPSAASVSPSCPTLHPPLLHPPPCPLCVGARHLLDALTMGWLRCDW
ncbi:hypothetical protein [Caudoviricetes sp.]|nr:hypothetical protein [Caudoviricetes sp.]